jgi:hypothetical protein
MTIGNARRCPALIAAVMLCGSLCGCLYHHQKNAPGHVDVKVPPRAISCERVETPDDPGEYVITLATGAFFGGGAGLGRTVGTQGLYSLGLETTLHLGVKTTSHLKETGFLPLISPKFYPSWSVALNLGWHLLEREQEGAGVGPGYLELQLFSLPLLGSGVAAGWAYDPGEELHGPHFTLFSLGIFYVRVAHMIDRGTDLVFGLHFKVPVTWVWSR